MGREIKFRAWDKANNKMLYGKNLWGDKGRLFLRLDGEIEAASCGSIVTTNYVLMQYTGLKDKNGVEIYEGDWFRDKNGIKYCVTIDYIGWLFINGDVGYRADKFFVNIPTKLNGIVIGNVYEHLELLKGGSD